MKFCYLILASIKDFDLKFTTNKWLKRLQLRNKYKYTTVIHGPTIRYLTPRYNHSCNDFLKGHQIFIDRCTHELISIHKAGISPIILSVTYIDTNFIYPRTTSSVQYKKANFTPELRCDPFCFMHYFALEIFSVLTWSFYH